MKNWIKNLVVAGIVLLFFWLFIEAIKNAPVTTNPTVVVTGYSEKQNNKNNDIFSVLNEITRVAQETSHTATYEYNNDDDDESYSDSSSWDFGSSSSDNDGGGWSSSSDSDSGSWDSDSGSDSSGWDSGSSSDDGGW